MEANINVENYYNKYGPMVFRRCRQLLKSEDDAMDALQDVFVSLLKQSGRLTGEYPSSLLYTMATNTCLNRLRAGKLRKEETFEEQVQKNEELLPDYSYEKIDARLFIEDILRTEDEDTRTICFMHYADGMTLEETGKTVGLSISGVRKRLLSFKKRAEAHHGGNKVHE